MGNRAAVKLTIFLSVVALLTPGTPLHAGRVGHHGLTVDGEGGYVDCLSCHDGVLAKNVSPCLAAVCFFKGTHPVARPYPPAEKSEEFVPKAEAEKAGVRFVDGRVDCISCHDLANGERYHLRIETRNSRLCQSCHLK
jgi:doubled CXXCH motif protein